METKIIHQNKIKQIAREYEKNGYSVKIEPRGNDLPSFILDYDPDIIAINESEKVVIEVKTRTDLATIDKLKNIADAINSNKGWRFELVITSSKQETESNRKPHLEVIEISNLNNSIKEIKELVKLKHLKAAFILTWGYLESISRQLLLDDNKKLTNKNPLTLVKTLFSFGYIAKRDLDNLEKLFRIRNEVVHGYQSEDLENTTIETLLEIIEKIVNENR